MSSSLRLSGNSLTHSDFVVMNGSLDDLSGFHVVQNSPAASQTVTPPSNSLRASAVSSQSPLQASIPTIAQQLQNLPASSIQQIFSQPASASAAANEPSEEAKAVIAKKMEANEQCHRTLTILSLFHDVVIPKEMKNEQELVRDFHKYLQSVRQHFVVQDFEKTEAFQKEVEQSIGRFGFLWNDVTNQDLEKLSQSKIFSDINDIDTFRKQLVAAFIDSDVINTLTDPKNPHALPTSIQEEILKIQTELLTSSAKTEGEQLRLKADMTVALCIIYKNRLAEQMRQNQDPAVRNELQAKYERLSYLIQELGPSFKRMEIVDADSELKDLLQRINTSLMEVVIPQLPAGQLEKINSSYKQTENKQPEKQIDPEPVIQEPVEPSASLLLTRVVNEEERQKALQSLKNQEAQATLIPKKDLQGQAMVNLTSEYLKKDFAKEAEAIGSGRVVKDKHYRGQAMHLVVQYYIQKGDRANAGRCVPLIADGHIRKQAAQELKKAFS